MTDDSPAEDDLPRGTTIARFFLVPLLVVVTAVGIFLAFSLLTFEKRTPADYLQEVRGGSANRRWQAAFELSRSIGTIPAGPERDKLAAESLRIFQSLSGKRPEDVRVRRYLVLVLGKLGDPSAAPALLTAARDPDAETRLYAVWALGALHEPRSLDAVLEASQSEDGDVRKMAAYVLGQIGEKRAVPRLQVLAEDRIADVRWNAAIALARKGREGAAPVLRQMLDRQYVEQTVKRDVRQDSDEDPVADVLISGLRAAAALKDESLKAAVTTLSEQDRSMKVRQAAIEALK